MKFDKANVSFCISLHLYMSDIVVPFVSQCVRIIHLGECSVAKPNLKDKKILIHIGYIIFTQTAHFNYSNTH